MADIPTTTLLVGLAVALARAIEWMAKSLIATRSRPRDGNGKHVTGVQSGQLTPEEWEGRMRRLHEESEEHVMRDIRALLDARNERIRQIIRDEIERRR